ncbi:MAG: aminotransferase class III-fold pyridoxal phosphate-dependent enzyme [Rhodospirillales bacterium]
MSCLGHGHPVIAAAITAQLHKIAYSHTSFFTSQPAEALADRIASATPGDLDHVYFSSSGSEAVEAALKMARQFHVECGQASRTRVISRRLSYHGATLGALAVSFNPARRALYEDLLFPVTSSSLAMPIGTPCPTRRSMLMARARLPGWKPQFCDMGHKQLWHSLPRR